MSLAERFGWTLEYVDALPMHEALEIIQVVNQRDTAVAKNTNDHRRRR